MVCHSTSIPTNGHTLWMSAEWHPSNTCEDSQLPKSETLESVISFHAAVTEKHGLCDQDRSEACIGTETGLTYTKRSLCHEPRHAALFHFFFRMFHPGQRKETGPIAKGKSNMHARLYLQHADWKFVKTKKVSLWAWNNQGKHIYHCVSFWFFHFVAKLLLVSFLSCTCQRVSR